jgi:hypothetical protein
VAVGHPASCGYASLEPAGGPARLMGVRGALLMIMAAFLAACAAGPAPGVPRGPGAGTVAGRLVSQRSDGSHRAPLVGQAVGVFTQAVIPGKVLQHPPVPLATAVTSADGGFVFHGLRPGRYFITVAGPGPAVSGRWVRLTVTRGAWVLLVHCLNCPAPL